MVSPFILRNHFLRAFISCTPKYLGGRFQSCVHFDAKRIGGRSDYGPDFNFTSVGRINIVSHYRLPHLPPLGEVQNFTFNIFVLFELDKERAGFRNLSQDHLFLFSNFVASASFIFNPPASFWYFLRTQISTLPDCPRRDIAH